MSHSSGKFNGSKLLYNKNIHSIELNDIVERFCDNDDFVIFNRQPTLQKQSMCGYKVRFQDKLSVGIHISSTTGHNADFDGDEGNIHLLQTAQAQSEASTFMWSASSIMSDITSAPVGGIIYNGASGGYLLSDDSVKFKRERFDEGASIMKYCGSRKSTIKERYEEITKSTFDTTGKMLCSLLFPEDFWYKNGKVNIVNGVLLSGQLSKNMGPSPNSIVQSIFKNYGRELCRQFITDANYLFNWYLKYYCLTVSIKDCRPVSNRIQEFDNFKNNIIDKINNDVKNLPDLPFDATDLDKEQYEERILDIIDNGTNTINTTLVKDFIGKENTIGIMAASGAKGKINDTAKIVSLLGQQYVPSQRPQKTLNRNKRWLSSFHPDDKSIYSRGFIRNSFYEGLEPDEFFAHSMASRVGLSNTGIKTADIGDIQRRMVKSLEDAVSGYCGAVINNNGNMFQLSYGTGFAASQLIRRKNDISERII